MGDDSSRPEIVIVGLGPGALSWLTREAEDALLGAERVLFRTVHPAIEWLRERGRDAYCFNLLYTTPRITYEDVYAFIVQAVVREAEVRGRAVYAVPGHPFVLEHSAVMIAERARALGLRLRVVPGMSFVDLVGAELRLDTSAGLQLYDALDFVGQEPTFTPDAGLLIAQLSVRHALAGLNADAVAGCVAACLSRRFPSDHPVSLVWTTRRPEYATCSRTVRLSEFVRVCAELTQEGHAPTAYVPPVCERRPRLATE